MSDSLTGLEFDFISGNFNNRRSRSASSVSPLGVWGLADILTTSLLLRIVDQLLESFGELRRKAIDPSLVDEFDVEHID